MFLSLSQMDLSLYISCTLTSCFAFQEIRLFLAIHIDKMSFVQFAKLLKQDNLQNNAMYKRKDNIKSYLNAFYIIAFTNAVTRQYFVIATTLQNKTNQYCHYLKISCTVELWFQLELFSHLIFCLVFSDAMTSVMDNLWV